MAGPPFTMPTKDPCLVTTGSGREACGLTSLRKFVRDMVSSRIRARLSALEALSPCNAGYGRRAIEETVMKNERLRNAFGHAAGFALFVLAAPALMRRVSGRPCPNPGTGALRVAPAAALMLAGLALAIWAIVELRVAGKGNPFRPPRPPNRHRKPETPDRRPLRPVPKPDGRRNPPLLPWHSPPARLAAAQAIQIRAEERRLLRDFGSEYETYRASAPAIVPYGVVPRRSR